MFKLVIFERRLGWYWKVLAANNRKQGIGGEPFSSSRSALTSFQRFRAAIATTPAIELANIEVRPLKRRARKTQTRKPRWKRR